jgi:hypothetical protein
MKATTEPFELNDPVKSLVTWKKGIIYATSVSNKFCFYHGSGYEHLTTDELEHIDEKEIPEWFCPR